MGRGCVQAGVVLAWGVPDESPESAVFDKDLSSKYWYVKAVNKVIVRWMAFTDKLGRICLDILKGSIPCYD